MNNNKSSDIETFPPGQWGDRPAPRGREIRTALQKARDWWWYAAFGDADDCLQSFLDLFDRYLGEGVRNQDRDPNKQQALDAFGESVPGDTPTTDTESSVSMEQQ